MARQTFFFCLRDKQRLIHVKPAGMSYGSRDAASCQNERSKVFNNSGGASRWKAASCYGRYRWPASGDIHGLLRTLFILIFPLSWMCSRLIFRAAFLWKTADHIALGRSWRELASQLGASEAARICDVFANLSATRVVPQQLRTRLPVRSFIITEGTFSSRVALLSNRLTC